jgi:hypothetical protein
MGLFRALIVVAVGSFILSIINDDKKMKAIPLVGKSIDKKVKEKKHLIVLFSIALLELIL